MGNVLRRALLPSLEILLFGLVFYISLFFMPDMLNSDGDLGRHLTVGQYILDTRDIPAQDFLSHTRAGEPLVLHEWLSEVVYAVAYRAAGLNGVAWLTALLLALIYLVLAIGLRALSVSAPIAFLAAFASYLTGMIHHLPRPHLFTLFFFTVFVLLLERYRRAQIERPAEHSLPMVGLGYLLALIPIMLLWANLNGAFVLGFLVLGIYIVGTLLERELRHTAILTGALAATMLASLLNPYGAGLLQHVVAFMGNRFLVDNTVEYLSPDFHNISAWMFAAWILFSIILFGRLATLVSWTHLLLIAAWAGLGLYSARNIPNYAQVAAIVTAPALEGWVLSLAPALRVRLKNFNQIASWGSGWGWGLVIVLLLVNVQAYGGNFDARAQGNTFTTRAFPVNAVNYLEKNLPPGNMFNEYTWGGYLEYRLFPKANVFIDGDNDFFGEALVREYLNVINARGDWEGILEKYNVAWVIVPPPRPLANELARSKEWREVYRDEGAGVWVRNK